MMILHRAFGLLLVLCMAAASSVVTEVAPEEMIAAEEEVYDEGELEIIDLFPEQSSNKQLRGSGERELQYMAPNKYCNWCGGPPSVKLGVVILGLGATSCHGAYQAGLNSQLPGNYCQPTRAYLYKKCGCGQSSNKNQYGSNGMGKWTVKGGK